MIADGPVSSEPNVSPEMGLWVIFCPFTPQQVKATVSPTDSTLVLLVMVSKVDDPIDAGSDADMESNDDDEPMPAAASDHDEPAASSAPVAGPAGDSSQKLKKSELFAAYKTVGPHAMFRDIMCDDLVRSCAEILTHITKPLHEQYRDDLANQKNGVERMLEWAAQRSLGSTQSTVIKIFQAQASKELFTSLRLPECSPPLAYNADELQDDVMLTKKAASFAVNLSANYAWSEMLHHFTLPLAATGLLAQNQADQKKAMKNLKRIVQALSRAEELAPTNPSVQALLRDVAYQEETMAREIMILLLRGNFSLDSPEASEVCEAMRRFNSGTASTKELLESTFAHLSYCVNASNKNKVIAPNLLWMYLTGSPYVKDSGMIQHIPTQEDWVRWVSSFGKSKDDMMKAFNKSFKTASTELPTAPDIQLPKTVAGIVKSKWRLAGPAAHYRSSAATAFMVYDMKHDFQNCHDAWAGHWFQKK